MFVKESVCRKKFLKIKYRRKFQLPRTLNLPARAGKYNRRVFAENSY